MSSPTWNFPSASLSAPRLFQIAGDLTRMQVETKIDEADIGRVVPGLSATFTVDAFPEDTFEGSVRQVRLEPVTEQNVVTYTTVIDVTNPDLKLKPGMTANVTIRIEKKDDVLRVPKVRAYGDRPATEAYIERVTSRPAFQKAHADQLTHFATADKERSNRG